VLLGDEVEVGANACIDRGALGDTVVGRGTRIDNLAQLGHNVQLGRSCVVVSQVGISGSAVLGDWVQVAGQAGIAGHLKIGDRARIGAQAGVMRDVEPGADMLGSPARPARVMMREVAIVKRLAAAAIKPTTKKDNEGSP
jgi:UDP-3-O-[3-hydroxymyristoyl] glucosamine N-acyltransferase